MKILVIGAGGLGGFLAGKLIKGGHDVSLLARGERLRELRQNGLVLKHWITGDVFRYTPQIVDALLPDDEYDLAILVMGKHHHPALLPALQQASKIPTVLFAGNNVAGAGELIAALGKERVLLGFLSAVGSFEDGQAVFAEGKPGRYPPFILGEPDNTITPRLQEVTSALEASQFTITIPKDITAWLKTHAAVVVPLGCALYLVDGRPLELAATPDAVLVMLRGMREALKVQRKLGIPIDPQMLKVLAALPEPLLVWYLQKILRQPEMKYAVGHAGKIRPEFTALSSEMRLDAQRAGIPTPNLDRLFTAIDPQQPTLTQGSREMPANWKELLPWIGIPLLVAGLIGLRRKKRRAK